MAFRKFFISLMLLLTIFMIISLCSTPFAFAEQQNPGSSTITIADEMLNGLLQPHLTLAKSIDLAEKLGFHLASTDDLGSVNHYHYENGSALSLLLIAFNDTGVLSASSLEYAGDYEDSINTGEELLAHLTYQLCQKPNIFSTFYSHREQDHYFRWAPQPDVLVWVQADLEKNEPLWDDGNFSLNISYMDPIANEDPPCDPFTEAERLLTAFTQPGLTFSDLADIAAELSLYDIEDAVSLDGMSLTEALAPTIEGNTWKDNNQDNLAVYLYGNYRFVIIAQGDTGMDQVKTVTLYSTGSVTKNGVSTNDLLLEHLTILLNHLPQNGHPPFPGYDTAASWQLDSGVSVYLPEDITHILPIVGDFSVIFNYQ